jgi:hypothetical protein
VKGDLPGELIFRWFALRAMKILSIFAFALFLPAVVNAQSNQNADGAIRGVVDSSATTRSLPVGEPPIANLPATCNSGDEYFDLTSRNKYSCTATNTWTQQSTAALVGTPDPVVFDHSGNRGPIPEGWYAHPCSTLCATYPVCT